MRGPLRYERLEPAGPPASAPELLAEVDARERAREDRPFVAANMISSLDGRAALRGGTRGLGGGDADLELLLELRVIADAVLVGTGTLAAEGYGRLVRSPERRSRRAAAGLAPDPTAVVITRSGWVPWDAPLFAAPEQPVLVYGPVRAPGAVATTRPAAPPRDPAAPVEHVALEVPGLAAVLADLRARGVSTLVCEGGPTLLAGLIVEELVDELFLTVAPLLTAESDAPRLLERAPPGEPRAAALRWVLRSGDALFLRYGLAKLP